MATLKKKHLVKKRNMLNEIKPNTMSLTELRFFSIYLSKIHKDKPNETRVVRFPLDDFKAIMELSSRINIKHMQSVTDGLLCKVVNVPIEGEKGKYIGYTAFQLFKECTVSQDNNGEWYVEIDAHDKALPLMFEYKNKYFSYTVDNVLRLRSPNQHKMYELLKQYELIGWRVFAIDELKELLGIGKDEYGDRWDNFKRFVLDACQKALEEHTDIKFTYEPHGKKGKGGKILSLKFTIEKNKDYTDQITLFEFIGEQQQEYENAPTELEYPEDEQEEESELVSPYVEKLEFLSAACDNEFSIKEITVLYDLMVERLPYETARDQIKCYDYLLHRFRYMNMRHEKNPIANRFAYMKSIIGKEI